MPRETEWSISGLALPWHVVPLQPLPLLLAPVGRVPWLSLVKIG